MTVKVQVDALELEDKEGKEKGRYYLLGVVKPAKGGEIHAIIYDKQTHTITIQDLEDNVVFYGVDAKVMEDVLQGLEGKVSS